MNIDIHDASIKTAAVEVKALTISGKQVTLAVFRQLVNEPVLTYDDDERASVKGPVWGTVNYHPDPACKGNTDHIHVVWQRGDQLRRARVDLRDLEHRPRLERGAEWLDEVGEDWLRVASGEGWRPNDLGVHHGRDWIVVKFTPGLGEIPLPEDILDHWQREEEIRSYREKEQDGTLRDYETRWFAALLAKPDPVVAPPPPITRDDALAAVNDRIVRRQSARAGNAELAQALAALPQLFIAV